MTLCWSKTVPFWEQVVQFPLPLITDCTLCSVIAIQQAISSIKHPLKPSQTLSHNPRPSCGSILLPRFNTRFLLILNLSGNTVLCNLGLPARNYASHSFCWGGASFAFHTQLLVKLIKIDVVLLYLIWFHSLFD